MAEKVYLTADQYVVKCLEEKEQQLAKLEEKYDDLLAKFIKEQAQNKEIKALFKVGESLTGNAWQISFDCNDGEYAANVAYEFNKEEPSASFLELLNLLGLKLPKEPKEK